MQHAHVDRTHDIHISVLDIHMYIIYIHNHIFCSCVSVYINSIWRFPDIGPF